jgi:glycine/D-amino acid oxidase-like deaminating enzyme/nitrite reductase/ring-hydroxylating ferredoxin subunit
MATKHPSYWLDSAAMPHYPAIDRNLEVDVVIVGGGITGLTTAYLLKRAGQRVAVLDRFEIGGVDTMCTTAHVTCVTDSDLHQLIDAFGRDHAQAVWDAGQAAIQQIETIVREETIACEWRRVTGYRFLAPDDRQATTKELAEEAQLAIALGFQAELVEAVPLVRRPGIAYPGQAKFHPRKYLAHLAAIVDGNGSFVFAHTACDEIVETPMAVKSGPFQIATRYVVLATHNPIVGTTGFAAASLLQTKLSLYSSYVVGGRIALGTAQEALFWDTDQPYHYLRIDRHSDHEYAIFGGEDHKTGQVVDTSSRFDKLEAAVTALLPQIDLTHRWSGQVIETADGLPFIGETAERQFAATGFAGNGMTFGTLAAMMARDAALGRKNPWSELFDVGRTKIKAGARDYLKENLDYPYYMVRDRLAGTHGESVQDVARGEGKLLYLDGRRVAVSRDADGTLRSVSAVCTHLGCLVGWNAAEQTWDCPCHGSRFLPNGSVLAGPAESPLEKM